MDQIADTFEQTMDSLIDRLQGYRKQAEEYRNQCIDGMSARLIGAAISIVYLIGCGNVSVTRTGFKSTLMT